jgi:hypothetical protein
MTHAVAALPLGIIAAAVLAGIFVVDLAMVDPGVVTPAVADRVATSAVDQAVVAGREALAAVVVVVSAAVTGGTHARRHLHVSRRATAPWRRLGPPL